MESQTHMEYVRRIASYLEAKFPCVSKTLLYIDLPDSHNRPQKVIGGYIPDLYYLDSNLSIIGEAKTQNDVDNRHAREQINAYIDELAVCPHPRHLILCSSIYSVATLSNYARKIRDEKNVSISIHILDDFDRIKIV